MSCSGCALVAFLLTHTGGSPPPPSLADSAPRTVPARAPAQAPAPVRLAGKVVVKDSTKIYYGSADTSKAPSTIESSRVYDAIPEWQEIGRRGLTPDDIDYWVLRKKAAEKFRAAVKSGAEKEKKDLVAEVGAIEVAGETIPDITSSVIAEIDK